MIIRPKDVIDLNPCKPPNFVWSCFPRDEMLPSELLLEGTTNSYFLLWCATRFIHWKCNIQFIEKTKDKLKTEYGLDFNRPESFGIYKRPIERGLRLLEKEDTEFVFTSFELFLLPLDNLKRKQTRKWARLELADMSKEWDYVDCMPLQLQKRPRRKFMEAG